MLLNVKIDSNTIFLILMIVLWLLRVNSRSWWWTGRSGMLQFMGLKIVGHNWATELNWTVVIWNFLGDSDSKDSVCNWEDLGLIPGLGRSPGEGNGYPIQYSCLENPMDKGAWWATIHGVTKSQTRLSDFHFHFSKCIKIRGNNICFTTCCLRPKLLNNG